VAEKQPKKSHIFTEKHIPYYNQSYAKQWIKHETDTGHIDYWTSGRKNHSIPQGAWCDRGILYDDFNELFLKTSEAPSTNQDPNNAGRCITVQFARGSLDAADCQSHAAIACMKVAKPIVKVKYNSLKLI
jgi:hypothetical protein